MLNLNETTALIIKCIWDNPECLKKWQREMQTIDRRRTGNLVGGRGPYSQYQAEMVARLIQEFGEANWATIADLIYRSTGERFC